MPAALYPSALNDPSFERTASNVATTPSLRALSITFLTSAGCSIARPTRPFCPASTVDRSVPALINDAAERTRTKPGRATGVGTSVTATAPVLTFWRICFIRVSKCRLLAKGRLRLSPIEFAQVNCLFPLPLGEGQGEGAKHSGPFNNHFRVFVKAEPQEDTTKRTLVITNFVPHPNLSQREKEGYS